MIQVLDQETVNKIAAGEVVERPASVVKELVENSIDAGASAITVEIKEGGIDFIRITDNGSGIAKDEIEKAFLRHSTSKIRQVEDLYSITSLGFRGEALASIAAVSQLEMITKTYEELTGIRFCIEGSVHRDMEEIGCPEGTTIIVKNLFYNTPARKKFLKKPNTEAGYIGDFIHKLALGHPHISFKLIYNNKVKLHTSGNNELKHCIFNIYGKEVANNCIYIEDETDLFSVKGYIGKPHLSRGNRHYETFFVNGRYIKNKILNKAVEDGFETRLMVHKYPFAVLYLTMNGKGIDVNVHPSKLEVKFNQEEVIYQTLKNLVYNHLYKTDIIPDVTLDKEKEKKTEYTKSIPEPFEVKRKEVSHPNPYPKIKQESQPLEVIEVKNKNISKEHTVPYTTLEVETVQSESIMKQMPKISMPIEASKPISKGQQVNLTGFLDKRYVKEHKIIGPLFSTYWLIELKDKLYFIDQHAAHERVLYERLTESLKASKTVSQTLLTPVIIHVTLQEKAIIDTYTSIFTELGFEIEPFGTDAYAVRSVPYIFGKLMKPEHFIDLLDSIDIGKHEQNHVIIDQLAGMACKAAVKGHDVLSVIEYQQLIDELMTLENPYTCPHGRPCIIAMTQYEIEKKFKRIQ